MDPALCADLPIDEVSDQATTSDASGHGQRKGGSRKIQAHASNEDHSLETFTKNGDEGQDEQRVLLTPELEAGSESATLLGAVFDFERFGELDTPLVLKFGHAEKGGTHDGDDEGCEDAERSLPNVLGACPLVFAQGVEGSDQAGTDDDAKDQTQDSAKPYLGSDQPGPRQLNQDSGYRKDLPDA